MKTITMIPIFVLSLLLWRLCHGQGPMQGLQIYVRSEGCDDANKTPGFLCGKATIKINGRDYSQHSRGMNVVILNTFTGQVTDSKAFDTYIDRTAATRMVAFLKRIPTRSIVIVAIQDEGMELFNSLLADELKEVGSRIPFYEEFRQSYALIGYKGMETVDFVSEVQQRAGQGPSIIDKRVNLLGLPIYVRSEGCNDANKTRGFHCGKATIKVNGIDYSQNSRGMNIVILNSFTGKVTDSRVFDTYIDKTAANRMVAFLKRIPTHSIVIVAIQDEGMELFNSLLADELKEVGSRIPFYEELRQSYALIGYKGFERVDFVSEIQRRAGLGPSIIDKRVKLLVLPPGVTVGPQPPTPVIPVNPAQCGISPVPHARVIAGKDSVPGAWPWQVSLYKYHYNYHCGGSLINAEWIVTAAHCLSTTDPSVYTIVLGDWHREIPESSEVRIKAKIVLKHPEYNIPPINNDIGLIKLSRPVQFTDRIRPVCLPSSRDVIPVNSTCFITGWGKISHPGSSHNILQEATLPVRGKQECQERLAKSTSALNITDQMLCAGHLGNQTRISGCHGDSGGPFVCQNPSGMFVLHGAVSWGSGSCNIQHLFTVFARITALRNWIDDMITGH